MFALSMLNFPHAQTVSHARTIRFCIVDGNACAGNRGHVGHASHGGRRCEDMHRTRRAQQQGANGHALAAGHLQHVEEDVRRIKVGADQQIGLTFKRRFKQTVATNRLRECGVALNLAIAFNVRGHVGIIQAVRGVHVVPDRHTTYPPSPESDQGEWLYTVVFQAHDLWGPQADPTVSVSVDAWESYLEPEVNA